MVPGSLIIDDVGQIGSGPGAYALLISVTKETFVAAPAGRRVALAGGTYLYAGSARGPGGIGARVGRHLRPTKRPHWHLDQLTKRHPIAAIGGFETLGECEIVARASKRPGANLPVPGFGSSDCRECLAHLVRLPGALDPPRLLAALGADTIWLRPTSASRAGR